MTTDPDILLPKVIIARAGGAAAVADASCGTLSSWAVYKWTANGIPERHWPLIMRLAGVSAEQLLLGNAALRRPTPTSEAAE